MLGCLPKSVANNPFVTSSEFGFVGYLLVGFFSITQSLKIKKIIIQLYVSVQASKVS